MVGCLVLRQKLSRNVVMSYRLHFVLLLVVVSAMAQTFQLSCYLFLALKILTFLCQRHDRYSRGWTNGRKRSDLSFIQQQATQQHGRPITVDLTSNSADDWSRTKPNEEVVFRFVFLFELFHFKSSILSVGHDGLNETLKR